MAKRGITIRPIRKLMEDAMTDHQKAIQKLKGEYLATVIGNFKSHRNTILEYARQECHRLFSTPDKKLNLYERSLVSNEDIKGIVVSIIFNEIFKNVGLETKISTGADLIDILDELTLKFREEIVSMLKREFAQFDSQA